MDNQLTFLQIFTNKSIKQKDIQRKHEFQKSCFYETGSDVSVVLNSL